MKGGGWCIFFHVANQIFKAPCILNDRSLISVGTSYLDQVPPTVGTSSLDQVPFSVGTSYLDQVPFSVGTSYLDHVPPTVGTSYLDQVPFSVGTSYLDQVPFSVGASFINQVPFSVGTSYLKPPSVCTSCRDPLSHPQLVWPHMYYAYLSMRHSSCCFTYTNKCCFLPCCPVKLIQTHLFPFSTLTSSQLLSATIFVEAGNIIH